MTEYEIASSPLMQDLYMSAFPLVMESSFREVPNGNFPLSGINLKVGRR